MSIASLKSRSSLTPIEDTEIDPLDFMNNSKFSPLKDRGVYSGTRNLVSLRENNETRREHGVLNGSDERNAQDSSSFEQSGTYSQSDTFATQSSQRPESAILSNEIYNSSDDRRHVQRTLSGYSEKTSISEVRGQSPSVLVVQESSSEHMLNTVYGTDAENDDDGYSMSELDRKSAGGKPLDGSGNILTNPSDSTNKDNYQSCNDLLKEQEDLTLEEYGKEIQSLKFQTDYEQSSQLPSSSNALAIKPSQDIQSHQEKSFGESLSSSYAEATEGYSGQNEPNNTNPNDETNMFHSTNSADRLDSVEHSYFASFCTTEQQVKQSSEILNTAKEDPQTDNMFYEKSDESCSLPASLMAKVGDGSQNGEDERDKTENRQSLDSSTSGESDVSNDDADSENGESERDKTENRQSLESSTSGEDDASSEDADSDNEENERDKTENKEFLESSNSKENDVSNKDTYSKNVEDEKGKPENRPSLKVSNSGEDDVSNKEAYSKNGEDEKGESENRQSLESSTSGENDNIVNKDAESNNLESNVMSSDGLISLPNTNNDEQDRKIHGNVHGNKSSVDVSITEKHTQMGKDQNSSGVESQEFDSGNCVSLSEEQVMSRADEIAQSNKDMEDDVNTAAPDSSQSSRNPEYTSEPGEKTLKSNAEEEEDATSDKKLENTLTEEGNEDVLIVLERSESSHEHNISEADRGTINSDPRVNGHTSEENMGQTIIPVGSSSLSRQDSGNLAEHSINMEKGDAVYAKQTFTSEKDDSVENTLNLHPINPDAEGSNNAIPSTNEKDPSQADADRAENLVTDNSLNLRKEESFGEFSHKSENETYGCEPERDLDSLKGTHKDKDAINANTENEDVTNEQEPSDLLQEPNAQAIERDVPNDEDKNEEYEPETASNIIGRTSPSIKGSEDSEPISETQEQNEKGGDIYAEIMRVSKSSSTLSVKTMSSSSSKISNSTHRSKEESKKLERLLKGPYSEKPTTPRQKARQKNETDKKKVIKSQEKPKPKSNSSARKPAVPKLQVHKATKKVNDNTRPKSKKSNAAITASKEKGGVEKTNSSPVKPDERTSEETMNSNQAIVNQRSMYHIKETDTEAEEIPDHAEINASANEPVSDPDNSTQNPPPAMVVSEQEEPRDEAKERCSDDVDSLGTQRSDSVSVKQTGLNEENNSISSDSGKPTNSNVSNKNMGEGKSLRQTLLLGKKKIIISSPKTSERLSAKEAKKATPLKSNGSNSTNMSPITVPKRNGQETNRPLTAPSANKGNTKKPDLAVVKPTTITVIDETMDSPKTNTTAGRIILNNIKLNLKKKSLQNNASSKVSRARSRSPSPEGNVLSSSGPHKEGKTAYKTQSMSSLQVPGLASATNSWDPPKEEDTLSTYSRRPSMDSVSRKSVDYRIRNTATVIQPQGEEKPKSVFNNDETFIQNAVPCLPLGLAIACLFLNTVLPGSGTALSGVSILCCGRSRLSNKEDQVLNTMCANLIVGLAQLFTVSFLLVGWFWSVGWGIKMVSLSVKRRQEIKQQREKDLQTLALSAFGSPKRLNGFGV